jgi:hypothetical protein
MTENAYMLEELDGVKFPVVVNGQHLKNIFPACGTTDIEQPIIRIRLYREGGRYVESANNKKIEKEKKKGKKNIKKEKRKRKREDTCTIVDEQPSTLGVPDFRKVLGYMSP